MGQKQSSEAPHEVPIEELSHQLALRFASKCYTHLEIAHFKDNFKSLADHQDDVEYWKEDTLCRFLSIPESLHAGPVLYQMSTYLGAFPFPSLAPCILTREAMLKIVTIMTGRYKKVLKRGREDRVKLLFRSLAVFDRRASVISSSEQPKMKEIIAEQKGDYKAEKDSLMKEARSHAAGFAIDEPVNDDEDEDDDDLALAALDALDAIEVFKHDHKADRKIHHAMIPVDNFKKLIMLLLLFSNLRPQSNTSSYAENLSADRLKALEQSATAIVAAFDPDPVIKGIRYFKFVKTASTILLDLFEPLNAMFEHFLFSKNLDLLKRKVPSDLKAEAEPDRQSPIYRSPDDDGDSILSDTFLSQLSISLKLTTPTSAISNIYQSRAKLNLLYSAASHGTSLSSFSRQIHSWESGTIILISGVLADSTPITIGAYLPEKWRDSSSAYATATSSDPSAPKATMFQLRPRHAIFPANPYNRTVSASYFSSKTGIALGCVIPKQSRTNAPPQGPILGPVGLLIDADLANATFQRDGEAGSGAFLTDTGLEEAQRQALKTQNNAIQAKKLIFEVDALEVWGISFPDDGGEDEVLKQEKKLAWEEAEAARRRGVNFGGDKDGARALLEMAGLVGDKSGSRSGGSV